MDLLADAMAIVVLVPMLLLPAVIIMAVLLGAIRPGGIWRDSFNTNAVSPARVAQVIASFAAAAAVLIGLAQSGGTAFQPLPEWLAAAAGGGSAVYLGTKWNAARQVQARRQQQG